MDDYTEMVKALRDGADFLENSEQDVPRNSFARMCRNAADAIDELTDTNFGKWISVKERLPLHGTVVIAAGVRSATTGMFQGTGKKPWLWHWKNNTLKTVTHWMPLPPQPDEETDGQTTL